MNDAKNLQENERLEESTDKFCTAFLVGVDAQNMISREMKFAWLPQMLGVREISVAVTARAE